MNFLYSPAYSISCRSLRTIQKCHISDSFIRGISSVPIRRNRLIEFGIRNQICPSYETMRTVAFEPRHTVRTYASERRTSAMWSKKEKVIRRFEDLPKGYKDGEELPFRETPFTKAEAEAIFGAGVSAGQGTHLMSIIHGWRVAGLLAEPSITIGIEDRLRTIALSWLRQNVPVDEEECAAQRAILELSQYEEELLADSERLGLYKPNAGEKKKNRKKKENVSVYGESGLDAIRKAKEKAYEEREAMMAKKEKSQADEIRQNTGTLAVPDLKTRVELRRPGENSKLKYYLERASKVVPEVPPEMTWFQRLGPSAAVAFLVVGGSLLFVSIYTPPATSARMWPEIPPAAATIIALICLNSLVFAAWHVPPAYRILNKYFLQVPGYPRGLAVLGNIFSHQKIGHLAANMAFLWFVGTRLHDDVGRANFLAIYLSSGVLSSLTSLVTYTARGSFITSSLGASGAVTGIIAAYLWTHATDNFKVFWFPPDPWTGAPGWVILGVIVCLEILTMRKAHIFGSASDHYSHLGGYATGVVGAQMIKTRVAEKKRLARERREKMSMAERIQDSGSNASSL